MPELHVSLSFRILVLLLSALCSIGGAFFVYRITVPPVSPLQRGILISLRSLGLFFLFLLIGEPLLSLKTHSIDEPILSVLVDDSQSMAIHDRIGRRDETLKSILQSPLWQDLGKNTRIHYSLFSGKIRTLSTFSADSLTFQGNTTNIADALKSIKQNAISMNIQAVLLITDGNSTVGMNPLYEAEELNLPVFSIGVGDTSEQKDILIRKVLTNEIAYAGTKVPVHVMLHSSGYGGERIQVSLRQGATLLDEKTLVLEPGTQDYLQQLSFVAENAGTQKFTVDISQLPHELTPRNNNMSFFTKVLKSKVRVTLIAGAPSQDAACIRNMLMMDKNIDLKVFIERNEGRFYEGDLTAQGLSETDCLILVGFPSAHSDPRTLQEVLHAADAGKPLFTILSRTIDFGKLKILEPNLPFTINNVGSNELQVFVDAVETERENPILKTANGANAMEVWSTLPPVFRPQGIFHAKIESEILATARFQSMALKEPFLVARNVNKKKILSVLGYGLWRWNLLSGTGSETEKVLGNFLSNALRWLTTQEDARRIVVQPTKHSYTTQDAIEFTAQVYDANVEPLDDAQIEVRAHAGSDVNLLMLNPLGSGQYQGAYDRLPEGEYKFSASVKVNDVTIGEEQGTFSVGGFNTEFLETRMNKTLLQQIAEQTGGRYYESNMFSSLPHDVDGISNFKPRDVSKSMEIDLWNSRWALSLVIVLFAMEWFLRKRNGML
jgi:hypothetical protein